MMPPLLRCSAVKKSPGNSSTAAFVQFASSSSDLAPGSGMCVVYVSQGDQKLPKFPKYDLAAGFGIYDVYVSQW
jgi:hypothetical protein